MLGYDRLITAASLRPVALHKEVQRKSEPAEFPELVVGGVTQPAEASDAFALLKPCAASGR